MIKSVLLFLLITVVPALSTFSRSDSITPVAESSIMDYKESHLLFEETTFDKMPEKLLKKRLNRYKISKLS